MPNILALSSFYKGNRFLERVPELDGQVTLMTVESLRHEKWPRRVLAGFEVVPDFRDAGRMMRDILRLTRHRKYDAIVALDECDVEIAAAIREQFRIPGLGTTAASYFRDKLAMRERAKAVGVRVPEFVAAVHDPDIVAFLERIPGPWLVKPRGDASAAGIRKCEVAQQVWDRLDELGDRRYGHLIEQMVPGDLFHVDSLMSDGEVAFTEVNAYWRPLLDVYQGGQVYATRTLDRSSPDVRRLNDANARVLKGFGLTCGASHTEFMRAHADGEIYFIETSCRVGGAETATMVEAATGINLWGEWAAVELARLRGERYRLPPTRIRHAGVAISLARTEWPDTTGFTNPEIITRLEMRYHIGFVLAAETAARVEELLTEYVARIQRDFHATMPAAESVMG